MNIRNRVGAFAILLFSSALHGSTLDEYPSLSFQSKKAIGRSALIGGISTLGIYALGYSLFHNFTLPRPSEHPTAYALWAGSGALAMGISAYNYAPESHFTYAKKGLLELSNNDFFYMAVDSKPETLIADLKDYFFKEKFPLASAYNALNSFYEQLEKYRISFDEVLGSSRTDLYEEAYFFNSLVNAFQNMIKDMIKSLKEDPNFITECNAYAQLVSVNAAQSAAAAAWVNAINRVIQRKL